MAEPVLTAKFYYLSLYEAAQGLNNSLYLQSQSLQFVKTRIEQEGNQWVLIIEYKNIEE